MKKEKFITLSVKHLSKETTLEENNIIQELLKDSKYQKLYDELSFRWSQNYEDSVEFDFDEGVEILYSKIKKYDPTFNWNKRKKFNQYLKFSNVAASIIFLILISLTILYTAGFFDSSEQIITLHEKNTKPGQKSILTLFDGTKITLNANSTIKYPSHFGQTSREVYLVGEAYFEVIHDTTKPFIVHTDEVSTIVLGTKFNISAFPEDTDIKVSLIEGKVLISNKVKNEEASSFYLQPKYQFVFNKIDSKRTIQEFNIIQEVGWKDNTFLFKKTPLRKVFKSLGRTFGIKFKINSSSNIRLTANFNNASFRTILKTIKSVTKLNYKIEYNNDNDIVAIEFYNKK